MNRSCEMGNHGFWFGFNAAEIEAYLLVAICTSTKIHVKDGKALRIHTAEEWRQSRLLEPGKIQGELLRNALTETGLEIRHNEAIPKDGSANAILSFLWETEYGANMAAMSMMTNLSSFDIHSEGGVEEVTLFDDSFKFSYQWQ